MTCNCTLKSPKLHARHLDPRLSTALTATTDISPVHVADLWSLLLGRCPYTSGIIGDVLSDRLSRPLPIWDLLPSNYAEINIMKIHFFLTDYNEKSIG